MKPHRLAYRLMCIGGIIELLIAIIHFIWPFELVKAGEYALLTGQYRDLLFLSSISIGLCLCIFGILSIYFSRRLMSGEKSALFYNTSQAILWGGRAIGELIFPVSVPMYFIKKPDDVRPAPVASIEPFVSDSTDCVEGVRYREEVYSIILIYTIGIYDILTHSASLLIRPIIAAKKETRPVEYSTGRVFK